jgi:hypothetical protein
MLLLEGYTSSFTRARYHFLCVVFSDFYVNQSLAAQTYTDISEYFYLCLTTNINN